MVSKKESKSVSSTGRLEAILEETERELESLQPQIEKLEKSVDKLRDLKLTKQKLITLKLSIRSILENFGKAEGQPAEDLLSSLLGDPQTALPGRPPSSLASEKPSGDFFPDQAFEEVDRVLKQRDSLNYEIFRAIVYNGGQATTEEIRQYLVAHNIKQPHTGESFEVVPLTAISSRANYLVRKGVAEPAARGSFRSLLGWRAG